MSATPSTKGRSKLKGIWELNICRVIKEIGKFMDKMKHRWEVMSLNGIVFS